MIKKSYIVVLMLGACFFAHGFDSDAWMAKRNDCVEMNRLAALFKECSADEGMPANNLKIPVELFPDGSIKTRLTARHARVYVQKGIVWAEGITIEQYKADGELDASLSADNCVVDRNKRTGWCEGSAVAKMGSYTLKGKGIYFSLTEEFIKITSDAEIIMSGGGIDLRRVL